MGKTLAEKFPVARQVFEEADDVLQFPLTRLCFEGPDDQLKLTENTQPALVTVSTAACRVAAERGLRPDYVAGHSLGEYSALVAAGALTFAGALRLVRKRGRYMQEAVAPGVGAMAAILRLAEGKLDAILAEASQGEVVTAANYNSPEQIVIAGHVGAVQRAMDLCKAAGAKRAVSLPVSAPFHCPLMKPAQERMKADLDSADFRDLAFPLVNNWEAREIRTGAQAREGLVQQIPNPVRWSSSMKLLAERGTQRWFEVGAGMVLSGLLRVILPGTKASPLGEAEDFEVPHATTA
jgi:[acyl-carrier-protein] S-malonyltransferase